MTDQLNVPLASLGLLRQITDRHVVDQLLTTPSMTRAEIAAATGTPSPPSPSPSAASPTTGC